MFVVKQMTTANQRQSSKSSAGSNHSILAKLTATQQAGHTISHKSYHGGSTVASTAVGLPNSAQSAMNLFNRDSSYMTAKQAELISMRVRSHEGRYPPSSFPEQMKMNNPETDMIPRQSTNPASVPVVSEFSI